MMHHIVYWEMAKREVDVDDAELSGLRLQERVGDLYIELMDGQRLPLIWDHELSNWVAAGKERVASAHVTLGQLVTSARNAANTSR